MTHATHWFDWSSNVLYVVSGRKNRERLADIKQAAANLGLRLHRVRRSWAERRRLRFPFTREIVLRGPTPRRA